jgi:general secretion pathway protein D
MKRTVSLLVLVAVVALTGCAGTPFNPAPDAAGSPADELAALRTRQQAEPEDIDAQLALERRKPDYVRAELRRAEDEAAQGNYSAAIDHLGNALAQDPGNLKVEQDLRRLERRQQMRVELARAERLRDSRPQEALEIARGVLAEQPNHVEARRLRDALLRESQASRTARPQLSDALRKPVSLNFRQQPLSSIFEVISRVSGVNFVFDRDVQVDLPATLLAERTTAQDAINLLLRTNQLDKKVLDRHTLLIYPAQADKARTYQEFALRTFFLSHADAKSVMAALRQMIKPKDVYVDERINAVVVRDTPETIQVAERVVMGLDIPQSEVTLDVQVLEVNVNDKLDLGVEYPGRIQFDALGAGGGSSPMTLGDLLRINRDRIGVSGDAGALSAAINMLQKKGRTKTLANPKIRVRNLEKANIKIGERVPIVTTTNANGVVSESVSYQDVGLILKVEPRISLNDEVSVKVNLEVSNILSKETTKTGLVAYSLGTRNAETLMTAKNGETQILAGLVKRSETADMVGLPGLSGLPVVGRLFGSKATSDEKSEIVLLITPHIERNLDLPEAAVSTFLSGTETRVTTEPLTLDSSFEQAAPRRASAPDLSAPIVPADAAAARDGGANDEANDDAASERGAGQAGAAGTTTEVGTAAEAGAGAVADEPVGSTRGAGMMRMRADLPLRVTNARAPRVLRTGGAAVAARAAAVLRTSGAMRAVPRDLDGATARAVARDGAGDRATPARDLRAAGRDATARDGLDAAQRRLRRGGLPEAIGALRHARDAAQPEPAQVARGNPASARRRAVALHDTTGAARLAGGCAPALTACAAVVRAARLDTIGRFASIDAGGFARIEAGPLAEPSTPVRAWRGPRALARAPAFGGIAGAPRAARAYADAPALAARLGVLA